MAPNPGSRRRLNATGRSEGGTPHVRFYQWELESKAYRSLSPVARCVLLELKAFYNGSNNGSLFLSAREAGRRVGVGKTKAWQALRELQQKGFIRVVERGAFSWKTAARRGDATCWLLTEFPPGSEKGVGTKDFMRWKGEAEAPTKSDSRFAEGDGLSATVNGASAPANTQTQ
jgi:hypothetical protein